MTTKHFLAGWSMCFLFLTFGRNANTQSCPLAYVTIWCKYHLTMIVEVEVTPDMMLEGQG